MSIEIQSLPANSLETWPNYELILRAWLATGGDFLALNADDYSRTILDRHSQESLPKVDLVQFCSLRNFERGELGIRELHWKVNNLLVSSKLLRRLILMSPAGRFVNLSRIRVRYQNMVTRKCALDQIMGSFSRIGIVVPHYVEPRKSTIVISRNFAKSLLEFNSKGYLTFSRACFALARSSNFKCVRIANLR